MWPSQCPLPSLCDCQLEITQILIVIIFIKVSHQTGLNQTWQFISSHWGPSFVYTTEVHVNTLGNRLKHPHNAFGNRFPPACIRQNLTASGWSNSRDDKCSIKAGLKLVKCWCFAFHNKQQVCFSSSWQLSYSLQLFTGWQKSQPERRPC